MAELRTQATSAGETFPTSGVCLQHMVFIFKLKVIFGSSRQEGRTGKKAGWVGNSSHSPCFAAFGFQVHTPHRAAAYNHL